MHLQRKILEKHRHSHDEGPLPPAQNEVERRPSGGETIPAPFVGTTAAPESAAPFVDRDALVGLCEMNASADFVRFTSEAFPRREGASQCALPLGVFVKPFGPAAVELPQVDLIPAKTQPSERVDIPRCEGCRAYVNPFFVFKDKGQRYECNICQLEQAVPPFYCRGLDAAGLREDRAERPELCCGSVEFVANEDYTSRPPKEPTFFFLIDASPSAHKSLVPAHALAAVKELLRGRRLGGEGAASFAIAFFDDLFHVVQIRNKAISLVSVNPALMQSPFELPNDRFVHYLEHFDDAELDRVLDALVELCGFSRVEASLRSVQEALKLATEMLCHQGGKVVLVLGCDATFPPKATDSEQAHRAQFNATESGFTQIAAEMHKWMIAADVYVFGHDRHKGLASLLESVRMSGSEPCYYAAPTAEELTRFYNELIFNCARPLAWESVFRLRVSQGWRKTVLANGFGSVGNDLIRPEQLDENFAFYFALEADERVTGTTQRFNPHVLFLQTSLLYTNSQRRRLIRVHNFALPLTDRPRQIYEGMDYQAVTSGLVRMALQRFPENKPLSDIQVELVNIMKRIASGVSQHASETFQAETLPYLTLAFLGLLKHEVFLAKYITNFRNAAVDRVSFARTLFNKVGHEVAFKMVNPSLFNLRESGGGDEGGFVYPPLLRLSHEALETEHVPLALLDCGIALHLFVLDRAWVETQGVFAGEEWSEEHIAESEVGNSLKLLVQELRSSGQRFLFMYIHAKGSEALAPFLIEERDSCGGFIHTYASFYEVFFKGISKVF